MSNKLIETRNYLEGLSRQELVSKAKNHYGVTLSREDKNEDIINKIIGMLSKGDIAAASEGDLKPGWARIKLHPVQGVPNTPRYVDHNGYFCWIPVNVEVDIPAKMVAPDGAIKCAGEWKVSKNEFDEQITTFEESLPCTVYAINPGPDPKPGIEVQRARKLKDKMEFRDEHGYWPSDEEIKVVRAERLKAATAAKA